RKPSGCSAMPAARGGEVLRVAAPFGRATSFGAFAASRVRDSVFAALAICAISNPCRSPCALIEVHHQGRRLAGAKTTPPVDRGLPQITARQSRSVHENRC